MLMLWTKHLLSDRQSSFARSCCLRVLASLIEHYKLSIQPIGLIRAWQRRTGNQPAYHRSQQRFEYRLHRLLLNYETPTAGSPDLNPHAHSCLARHPSGKPA